MFLNGDKISIMLEQANAAFPGLNLTSANLLTEESALSIKQRVEDYAKETRELSEDLRGRALRESDSAKLSAKLKLGLLLLGVVATAGSIAGGAYFLANLIGNLLVPIFGIITIILSLFNHTKKAEDVGELKAIMLKLSNAKDKIKGKKGMEEAVDKLDSEIEKIQSTIGKIEDQIA